MIAIIIIAAIILIIAVVNIRVVPQSSVYVIERAGTYLTTWESGIHFKYPLFDRVVRRISLKEQVIDFQPQPVITKDTATVRVDSVVFFQVTDAKLFTYGVENPIGAIEKLTATTLRNIIGGLKLDNTLTSRDYINTNIRITLDEATDKWGIKVNRVELKNILPPAEMQNSMEKEMKAERDKRANILRSEGEKESQILVSEGLKAATILKAEAEKEATILRADAVREQKIREAEGEAQSIALVQRAVADSIRLLNEAPPSQGVLTLKSFEAFAKAADGQATKIIIPSEIQSLGGLVSSIKEIGSGNSAATK